MGVVSTLGKFALKGAAKVGLGAVSGGGIPGAAVGLGLMALDVIPLIQDLASNGTDPEKVAKVKAMRDSMAQKLVETKGIPMEQALEEVNQQMKPLIDDATKSEGRSPGGTLLDAASIAGGLYLGKKAGMFGKAKAAGGGAAGAAETAAAKELAPEAASRASTGSREYVGATGERRAAEEQAARSGAMDSVTGDRAARLPATIPAREPEVMDRGFMQVPADGGTAPMNDDELKQMMIAALLRRQPQRPPGMQPRPAIGAPGA